MNSIHSHNLPQYFSGLNRPKSNFLLKFIKHIDQFMKKHRLISPSREYLLGVSGGADSMAMLGLFILMRERRIIKNLRVIFIHHQTRIGQNDDEQVVRSFCEANQVEFLTRRLFGLSSDQANFEMKAREMRHQEMLSVLNLDEYLIMAHHIDDSFEWSLLQQLRSSNLETSIGIPTKRGKIIRPFMCVTRQQIERFIGILNIPFKQDPTNADLHHERNYLRHEVVKPVRDRHPQYLKHYVERSNQIAMSRGQHLLSQKRSGVVKVLEDEQAMMTLLFDETYMSEFSHSLEVMKEVAHKLSEVKRGVLQEQLQKIIQATHSGAIGPLTLSGAVEVYLDGPLILFLKKTAKMHFIFQDQKLAQILQTKKILMLFYSLAEFKHLFEQTMREKKSHYFFPFWVAVRVPEKYQKYLRTKKLKLPLWPKTFEAVVYNEQFQVVSATRLIQLWQKDRLLAQLDMELSPLWSDLT